MRIIYYLKLMRFHFHISYITVIIGAMSFSTTSIVHIIPKLILCYLIFNVLIYGGLYTFNDIIDAKADSEHHIKKARPLPSRNISILSATIFSIILTLSGLIIAYFFVSSDIYNILLVFIALNVLYTLFFKHIIYLNLAIVAGTHTLRLLLGITLVEAIVSPGIIVAFYFLLFGVASTIHSMFNLKSNEMPYYTKQHVVFIQIASILLSIWVQINTSAAFSFPVVALTIFFLILVFCSHIKTLRPFIAKVFMIKLKTA